MIGILGFGIEGRATLNYLLSRGETELCVLDLKQQQLPDGVQGLFGDDYLQGIHQCATVYRTPGISPLHPELIRAATNGVEITSHTIEFFKQCPCPIIGVTGTKGKGTTSSLIYEICKANNKDVYLGGNIGQPPLDFLTTLTPDSLVVLELSSFQLMDCSYSPHIAVLLNVTSDHLDYHSTIMEYASAKSNIVAHQRFTDVCIYNEDYAPLKSILSHGAGRRYPISTKNKLNHGLYITEGSCSIARNNKHEHILFTKEFGLLGAFNYENVLPALAVAEELHLLNSKTKEVVRNFSGLSHRLHYVGEIQGVSCYDDSFSTNPDTTVAALSAFPDRSIALIIGGSDKGADFTGLAHAILKNSNIRSLIFLGNQAAPAIEVLIEDQNQALPDEEQRILVREDVHLPQDANELLLHFSYAPAQEDLKQAISGQLDKADILLLSPACASFDIFNNYKERGDFFAQVVRDLIRDLGGSYSPDQLQSP